MTQHQPFLDVTAKIRRWARQSDPNISFGYRYPNHSTHALDMMDADDIQLPDMLYVFRHSGSVVDIHEENGEMRHVIEGRTQDGRELGFAVNIYDEAEEIEVITAWDNARQ